MSPSPMPPSRPASQPTRAALLDAAERLFAESGFHAVGIREISSLAGTNVAAISYHFGSKGDLYVAVMRRAFDERETLDAWHVLEPTPQTAAEATLALVTFTRRFTDRVMAGEQAQRLCRLLIRESWRPSEALGDIANGFFHPHEQRITDALVPLSPGLDLLARRLHARSLFGQLLFPTLFRPFIEVTDGVDLSDADVLRTHADHVIRVTLSALDVDRDLVDRALQKAAP